MRALVTKVHKKPRVELCTEPFVLDQRYDLVLYGLKRFSVALYQSLQRINKTETKEI